MGWNASYADARASHVVAIYPECVWGLETSDVADFAPSTLFIGFGGPDDRMLATDFDRSGLSSHLGDRKIEQIEPADHFSAMPVCTIAGEAILAEENDDPVRTDPAGSDRSAMHVEVVNLIAEQLNH